MGETGDFLDVLYDFGLADEDGVEMDAGEDDDEDDDEDGP